MPSDVRSLPPPPLVTISGAVVSYVHTVLGLVAFVGALITALCLHYEKVVKNHVASYPNEWWPSVSATIGDWYPERNIFQVGIALMSGPRFVLVFLSALLVSLATPASSKKAIILLAVGILRTFACGGWVYVTSTDDHMFHDIAMAAYIILTPPWMFITGGSLAPQPAKFRHSSSGGSNHAIDLIAVKAQRMRRIASACFFSCIPPMVYFYHRHSNIRMPGAYSRYAYFEWGLIIFDLLFDAASVYDLSRLELHITEASVPAVSLPGAVPSEKGSLLSGAWIRGGKAEAAATEAWSTGALNNGEGGRKPSHIKSPSDDDRVTLRKMMSLLFECYLAFCFWTNLTALHPMIFYFSVYNMGIGGHELLLVSQVIGLLFTLIISPLRKRVTHSIGGVAHVGSISDRARAFAWLFSLAGIASWWIHSALIRLLAVAFSNALLAAIVAVEWGSAWETGDLSNKCGIWLVGLLLSNLAKYANHSNNPAWPLLNSTNGGLNGIATALAVVCVIEMLSRPATTPKPAIHFRSKSESTGSFFASALGMGSLLFTIHSHLTDTGTLIAWSWTGYPIKSPMAIPHGCFLLTAMAFSSLIATRWTGFGYKWSLFAVQCVSAYLLKYHTDWICFLGAIGFASSIPPLAFPIVSAAMKHHPLKIMFTSWLIANLLVFVGVLTVAYAFVPGGKIMRERTGFMLCIQLVFLATGLLNAQSDRKQPDDHHPSFSSTRSKDVKPSKANKSSTFYICLFMAAIGLAGNVVPVYRLVPESAIQPYHAPERLITAGMWTVHFGLDQNMDESSRRMASVIKDLELDLFGLVETDLHRTVFGNRDLTQYLAEELGMYADLGPAPPKNTWGAVLMSKFPIINSTHHLLPSPNGELAPAIHAVLDMYGVHTHVIVSHNGQEEDPLDRELQTTEIARILREAYPHPAIFLGYVVTKPHAERPAPYKILFEDGKIHDVETTDSDRWCQYLGQRGLERIAYARVSRYTVTDTEIQTMKLVVPTEPINPDENELTFYVAREHYSEAHWYPDHFIDPSAKVYDKHKYSPYAWPIYYKRPN